VIKRDSKRAIGGLRRAHHRRCIGGGGGHRLFAHHMLARLERGNGHRCVQVIWRGDADDVNVVAGDQLAVIFVLMRDGVFGGDAFARGSVSVRDPGDFETELLIGDEMLLTGPTQPDHPNLELVHVLHNP
jgi:hypothetical protein